MNITYFTQHHADPISQEKMLEVLQQPQDDGAIWIDVDVHQADEMTFLQKQFNFHPLAIEDVQHQDQRPKAEEFTDHLFIILNPIGKFGDDELFRELDVFVGKNYLITAHHGPEPVVSVAQKRLLPERVALHVSSTYLLYILMDTIVDAYLPILEDIENRVEILGNEALTKPNKAILAEIFRLKQCLNQIWWVVWPQQDIINVLTHHGLVFIDNNSNYYLRDIADHLARIMSSIQASRDTVTGLVNIYMSSVSNQLNFTVGRLTLLTIIIGIFAVYGGIYGMNFEHTWPPFDKWWGAPVAVMMMVGTAVLVFIIFRWRRWIE
jgi:magnesium transporter